MYPFANTEVNARRADRGGARRRVLPLLAILLALALAGGLAAARLTGPVASSESSTTPGISDTAAEPGEPAGQGSAQTPPGTRSVVLREVSQPQPEPKAVGISGAKQTAIAKDGPCAGLTGGAAERLIAKPDPVSMPGGGAKAGFVVYNCGPDDVSWTAASKPWVALAKTGGVLAAGATQPVTFTVDTSGLPSGPYAFKVKVSQPGHSTYVDVTGTKLNGFAAPAPAPSIGGLVAAGPTGCAARCITKAWLTQIRGSADMSLEVRTRTSAKITVAVDTAAPVPGPAGQPHFPAPDVTVASGAYRSRWVTTLKPLSPGTKYHIIVSAVDAKGGRSVEVGTFRTPKPVTGLAASEPGGCAANCVTRATLTPKPGTAEFDVDVTAYVPVRMRVYAGGDTPVASTGSQYRTEWAATLKLEHGRAYQITLKVIDEQGKVQVHSAKVSTPPAPVANHHNRVRVTFHKIHVSDDADNTLFNRKGELTFRFAVNGERRPELDTGERSVKAPAWVGLDVGRATGRSVVLDNAPDRLPIRVQAQERDNNQIGFCSAGTPFFTETSGRTTIPKCYELEWNTAEGLIDLHATAEGGALPPCYGTGLSGDICTILPATGDDPRFEVYLTVDFLD